MGRFTDEFVADVMANSYRNFHAKGMDYICISRTPALTEKVYLFEDFDTRQHAVVNPHDHRYNFASQVLAGELIDETFEPHPQGEQFNVFRYSTPLNGGDGFTSDDIPAYLKRGRTTRLTPRSSHLHTNFTEIHTIRVKDSSTVLLLRQYADRVPLDASTRLFTKKQQPPSLDGLYEKFSADQMIDRLRLLDRLFAKAAA